MSNTAPGGIPGLRGADHFGFTVPDMEQAVRFFVDVIGCIEVFTIGPFRDPKGNFMSTQLNVDPQAEIPQIRMLRCKNGANIELFEFIDSHQKRWPPLNSDIGGHHLAFYVDDMDEAVTFLRSKGIEICGEPVLSEDGAIAGLRWVYFLAPWGMQLELVSAPNGMAYERETDLRVWQPESEQ